MNNIWFWLQFSVFDFICLYPICLICFRIWELRNKTDINKWIMIIIIVQVDDVMLKLFVVANPESGVSIWLFPVSQFGFCIIAPMSRYMQRSYYKVQNQLFYFIHFIINFAICLMLNVASRFNCLIQCEFSKLTYLLVLEFSFTEQKTSHITYMGDPFVFGSVKMEK